MSQIESSVRKHFRAIGVSRELEDEVLVILDVRPAMIRAVYSAAMSARGDDDVSRLRDLFGAQDDEGLARLSVDLASAAHGVSVDVQAEEDDLSRLPVVEGKVCRTCSSVNTIVKKTRQMRSADEGDTTVYRCKNCKSSWTE